MKLDWLPAAPAERRLLGGERKRGTTPWVIAIMTFSIVIIAAAGLALSNAASQVGRSVQNRHSVQVPGGSEMLPRLVQSIREAPGVTSVEAVPESEMRATLARWLGPAAQSRELPVPALVHFNVAPGAPLAPVQARVRAVSPGASIASQAENLRPLLGSLRTLQWLALGMVLLLTAAGVAAVVLATRSALDTHRFTIEVMHGVGATDLQVTRLFQRKIAVEALIGSLGGAAAAGAVLLILSAGATFVGGLTGGASFSPLDILLLVLLPLVLTLIATWVARRTVLTALREAL